MNFWNEGKIISENPMKEELRVEKRLFKIDDDYYETLDEVMEAYRNTDAYGGVITVLDYIREFGGRKDVIRVQELCSHYPVSIISAVDQNHYVVYNNEETIIRGDYIWQLNKGYLEFYFSGFRDSGIVFENDVYEDILESSKKLEKN